MKKFLPHIIWISGLGIVFVAFVIGSLLGSGVPYPDPTPDQAAREAAENGAMDVVILIGLGLFLIGFFWAIGRMIVWLVTRLRS